MLRLTFQVEFHQAYLWVCIVDITDIGFPSNIIFTFFYYSRS